MSQPKEGIHKRLADKSAAPFSLQFADSGWHLCFLATLLVSGCLALWSVPCPQTVRTAFLFFYVGFLTMWVVRQARGAARGLRLDAHGRGLLARRDGAYTIRGVQCTYYTTYLIVLQLKLDHEVVWLPLLNAQFDDESWRRLRRYFAGERGESALHES